MVGAVNSPVKAAAVVLAAGRSTRMGARNKLLLEIEPGVAVVRRVVERARASVAGPVYVVTGHQAEKVREALAGLDCIFVHNPDFADGLSGSVRAGFGAAVDAGADGVIVLLGDMPFVPEEAIAAVREVASANPGRMVQAVAAGKPAHPVWLPARLSALVDRLEGDRGIRGMIAGSGEEMITVEVGGQAAVDLDTPQDYAAALAAGKPAHGD
jgi:molybdenum cofactor cytidylyltransferase